MVGVPKSNRCNFCKSRKTKCDEKWPTCGACARAGKICSGARTSFKFVVNGCHNEAPSVVVKEDHEGSITTTRSTEPTRSTARRRHSPATTIVDVKQYSKGGCSFGRMRLCQSYPRVERLQPLPVMNSSEQLAARLIACLDSAPRTGNDLHILGAFLGMVPQQLENGNVALWNAVELVIESWTNSRRELPPSMWLDLRIYNRALRSLKDALDDPGQDLAADTLTALCLLQKVEILYDFERGSNQENHAAGLIVVISNGGPWQGFTEMSLHLTFESYFHMLQEDIRLGRESVFIMPEWQTAFDRAIDANPIQPVVKQMYRLWVQMTVWPTFVLLVQSLCQYPNDSMTAAELIFRAMPVADYLNNEDQTTLASLGKTGGIVEVEATDRPDLFPTRYDFADFETAKLFSFHAMFGLVVNRVLQWANRMLGDDVPYLEERCKDLSRRIWMSHKWMSSKKPMSVDFTGALVFSYESGNSQEREFCLEALVDMETFRRPPPIGQWTEETIMANAKAYTGRLPFFKSQDISIETSGLGCRC
ncbi:hypothetical protein F5Y15DRAFT_380490 [Xylariaceae sp. FL0016]|nr:hypothetical protein F5Y15DRAFT_380490 [Xylariaceae sp. FL0016]